MGYLKKVRTTIQYAVADIDVFTENDELTHELNFVIYENEDDEPVINQSFNLEELIQDYLDTNTTSKMTSQAKGETLAKLAYLKGIIEKFEDNINSRETLPLDYENPYSPQKIKQTGLINLQANLIHANEVLDSIK